MDNEDLPPGGRPVGDPRWEPWAPVEVAERLADVDVPWCVAGGWALDLFAGQQTRPHDDIEIAVPAARFPAIRAALHDLEFDVPGSGQLWPVDCPAFDIFSQTWGRERATGTYRVDVFREPHDADTWVCRRDERIRLPYSVVVHSTAEGVPYLAPQIALLFKAKRCRPKDNLDFAATLPLMTGLSRDWLARMLRLVHPGHPWIAEL